MVQYCSVSGCSSRSRRDLVAFFRFPTVRKRFGLDLQEMIKLRREKWVNCIPRFKNLPEDKFKHARVCANHFISGKPAALQDVDDPDWVPSLNLRLEPRRVRLRRLAAAGAGLPPPLPPRMGAECPRIKPKGPDSDSDEGYRDVPNGRFLEPEVEIEVLDCGESETEDVPHRYGCPLCKTTFYRQEELRTHLTAHAGRSHVCALCRADDAQLREHRACRHSLDSIARSTCGPGPGRGRDDGGRESCEGTRSVRSNTRGLCHIAVTSVTSPSPSALTSSATLMATQTQMTD